MVSLRKESEVLTPRHNHYMCVLQPDNFGLYCNDYGLCGECGFNKEVHDLRIRKIKKALGID